MEIVIDIDKKTIYMPKGFSFCKLNMFEKAFEILEHFDKTYFEHWKMGIYKPDKEFKEESDRIYDLFAKPAEQLKPLEDLYREANPREDGKYYIPDTTEFYKWITENFIKLYPLYYYYKG